MISRPWGWAALAGILSASCSLPAPLGLWPGWRGPNRDNISTETGLLKVWPEEGPPLAWEVQGIGKGTAAVAVRDGRVYALGSIGTSEYVTALDESTGSRIWAAPIGPSIAEHPSMRWVFQRMPTVDGSLLYAFRGDGKLVCLRTRDGGEEWRRDYILEFGTTRHGWGNCDHPLIDGDRLICTPGGTKATIVALDKTTGRRLWETTAPGGAGSVYAATIVTEAGGTRQYVSFLQTGVFGFRACDGTLLWSYGTGKSRHQGGTPIVASESTLIVPQRWSPALGLVKLSPTQRGVDAEGQYFRSAKIHPWDDSYVTFDSHLYGVGSRSLLCIRVEDGDVVWQQKVGNWQWASFTCAERRLYVNGVDASVSLIEVSPAKCTLTSKFQLPGPPRLSGATNPVIAAGRLYLRDENRLFCYDVRQDAPTNLRLPAEPRILDAPVAADPASHPPTLARAVFVATPMSVVRKMLELAGVTRDDIVYDLGSGDGRILTEAAWRYGAKGVGFEIDHELVIISRQKIAQAGLQEQVRIEERDLFKADLSPASVVTIYLPEEHLERLTPQFEKLKPGSRIVSHQFRIPGAAPDKTLVVESPEDGERHEVHLWTAPLKK